MFPTSPYLVFIWINNVCYKSRFTVMDRKSQEHFGCARCPGEKMRDYERKRQGKRKVMEEQAR